MHVTPHLTTAAAQRWSRIPAENREEILAKIYCGTCCSAAFLTKAEGKMYGGQLGAGTLMSVYGAVIGVFSSLLYTTVVFQDSLGNAKEMQVDALAEAGQTAEQIEAAMPGLDLMFTPAASAIMGFIMTILTGFVLSLILAAFIRNKA